MTSFVQEPFDLIRFEYKHNFEAFKRRVNEIGIKRIIQCYKFLNKNLPNLNNSETIFSSFTSIKHMKDNDYFQYLNKQIDDEEIKIEKTKSISKTTKTRPVRPSNVLPKNARRTGGKYTIIRKKKSSKRFRIKKKFSKRINHKKFSKRSNKKNKKMKGGSINQIIVLFITSLISFSISISTKSDREGLDKYSFFPTVKQARLGPPNENTYIDMLFYLNVPVSGNVSNISTCQFVGKAFLFDRNVVRRNPVLLKELLNISSSLIPFFIEGRNPAIATGIVLNNGTAECVSTMSPFDESTQVGQEEFKKICKNGNDLLTSQRNQNLYLNCYGNDNQLMTFDSEPQINVKLDIQEILIIVFSIFIVVFIMFDIGYNGTQSTYTCFIPREIFVLMCNFWNNCFYPERFTQDFVSETRPRADTLDLTNHTVIDIEMPLPLYPLVYEPASASESESESKSDSESASDIENVVVEFQYAPIRDNDIIQPNNTPRINDTDIERNMETNFIHHTNDLLNQIAEMKLRPKPPSSASSDSSIKVSASDSAEESI